MLGGTTRAAEQRGAHARDKLRRGGALGWWGMPQGVPLILPPTEC